MKHKDFHIDKREGQNLGVNLNSWKLFADQFYRSSEVIFIQICYDYSKIRSEDQIQKKTGNFNNRKYTPLIDHVYFLLIGYCLEDMIKGILVYENPTLVSGGKLARSIKHHDLGDLARRIKIELSEEEKQLLDFLTPNIEWYSKYPIPANALDSIGSSGHQINTVREIFLVIYQKLSDKMQATGSLKAHLHNYKFS